MTAETIPSTIPMPRVKPGDALAAWLESLFPGEYARVGDFVVGLATVKPAAARTVLDSHNEHNRPVSTWSVEKLARSMGAGLFLLNGETVCFDLHRNIRNGRHRMEACVSSGRPFQTFVVAGLPEHVFTTYDQHQKRTLAQILQMRSVKDANIVASATRLLLGFHQHGSIFPPTREVAYTAEDELAIFSDHEGLRESAAFAKAAGKTVARRFAGSGPLCVLHYLLSLVDPALATEFLQCVVDATTPREERWTSTRRLNAVLLENVAAGSPLHTSSVAALVIKAWNSLRSGRPTKVLKYMPGVEEYPRISGWDYDETARPVAPTRGASK